MAKDRHGHGRGQERRHGQAGLHDHGCGRPVIARHPRFTPTASRNPRRRSFWAIASSDLAGAHWSRDPPAQESIMAASSYRSHATAQAEINVTPLVDVMLALVVILMITAPLAMNKLALPLAGSAAPAGEPHIARLSILSTGELFLDGNAINRAQLDATLRAMASSPQPPVLALRADRETSYDKVASALGIARNSGLTAIRVEGAGD
ncbi:MAG: biopolymer transporter ExbD [Xanthomonadales bacterium]|nr:biopolymer transporter ExbD [Xanthomonadales bacterium]MDL1869856.1 biopolymer transporter ExbD [Gammaproteobacteria bacterium PRO6]